MRIVAGRARASFAWIARATTQPQALCDLPFTDEKWPRMAQVAFIAGSAATLWALIYLGSRSH